MKRIMIIGCGGSGKSTLSIKLHQLLGLDLIQLDLSYWKSGWVETPAEEWAQLVHQFSERTNWVMDGNYGGTMDIRIKRADTIIFLDFPTSTCLFRVLKRSINHFGQVRPGLPEGCIERISLKFLWYVFHYRKTRRKDILNKLKRAESTAKIYILENDHQVSQFLKTLS